MSQEVLLKQGYTSFYRMNVGGHVHSFLGFGFPITTCPLADNSAWFITLSGKSPPMAEAAPVVVPAEETEEVEVKNELKLRIKEEHLAALQFEGSN